MKKNLMVAVVAASASIGLIAGCSGGDDVQDAPDYSVEGKVYSKWINYDCKAHGMAPMAFEVLPQGKSGGSSGGSKNKGTEDTGSVDSGNKGTVTKPSATSKPPTTSGGSSGGVATTKAPSAVKVSPSSIPTGTPTKPSGYSKKWCTTEPELFVQNKDGIFEQDVKSDEYDMCAVKEKFPSCLD